MPSSSTWPCNYLSEQHDLHRSDGNHLICFLICPFKPQDRYDDLFVFIDHTCKQVGQSIEANVECVRADKISTPGVIHHDIWKYIQNADVIIADVTGHNGNVMMELGVAASYRNEEQVIIIRDEDDTEEFLFDISPSRHFLYNRSFIGFLNFNSRLQHALIHALTPAPYSQSDFSNQDLPIELDLSRPYAHKTLLSPSIAHRRQLEDGIEFGSLYVFRNSWLTVGRKEYQNIHFKAEMKFTSIPKGITDAWIGIMLRSNHYFADYGHLVYVRADGKVMHTVPLDEYSKDQNDPVIGQLQEFIPDNPIWLKFDLRFDESGLAGSINEVSINIPATEMHYTYNSGLIRIQTYRARACLREVSVEQV